MQATDALNLDPAVAATHDAVSDDSAGRLSQATREALALLDQINRSGIGKALPALTSMVENGDLDRVAALARTYAAAEAAATDDMVGRVSEAVAGGLGLLDQFNRSGVAKALPALTQLVENGDLDRIAALARTYAAAEAAATDDMIGRVSEAVAGGLDMLDQLYRARIGKAVPALTRLVEDGDLDRLAALARTYAAAEAAATDDMIGRVSEAMAEGLGLLDQVNRANIGKALPALTRLVEDGDLDRVAALARTYAAAEAAVTDDMIGRLAETIGTSLSLVDRLNRAGIDRVVGVFERLTVGGGLDKLDATVDQLGRLMGLAEGMVKSVDEAHEESRSESPAGAGLFALLRQMREPENQKTIRFAFAFARRFRERLGKA
jgi:muramidase (phage lysozyme)